jgi:hypothetical protein
MWLEPQAEEGRTKREAGSPAGCCCCVLSMERKSAHPSPIAGGPWSKDRGARATALCPPPVRRKTRWLHRLPPGLIIRDSFIRLPTFLTPGRVLLSEYGLQPRQREASGLRLPHATTSRRSDRARTYESFGTPAGTIAPTRHNWCRARHLDWSSCAARTRNLVRRGGHVH